MKRVPDYSITDHEYKILYTTWRSVKRRTSGKVVNYSARGIKSCIAISSSLAYFINLLGTRPKGTSLNRIDNDGHYSCGTCKECKQFGWPMNLEWVDHSTQQINRRLLSSNKSGYRGVSRSPGRLSWRAQITINGVIHRLGYFKDIEEAAIEYDKAAIFFRGDRSMTNLLGK